MGLCQSNQNAVQSELATNSSKNSNINSGSSFSKKYKMGKELGRGGYSIVKLATNKATNELAAVKIVNRVGILQEDENSLREEVSILQSLDHPNITKVYDFYETKREFHVVLEYLEGGELFDRVVRKTYYNEKEARDLVYLILTTIKYLHDQNIVHRDLKPENLLLKSDKDDRDVKLADFGFAIKCDGDNITSQCGTPGYIAPDILVNKPYGKAVDMWSFGVIIFILLGGYPPFYDDNQRQLFRKILKADYEFHPDYWSTVSEEAKDLIKKLLKVNPKKRLTVDQALAHKWLGKSAADLAATSLDANLKQLKKYVKTRKFKKAVHGIIAVGRMQRLLAGLKGAAEEVALQEAQSGGDEDDDEEVRTATKAST